MDELQPFLVSAPQKACKYSYTDFNKEFVSDSQMQNCDKVSANELTGCFHCNDFQYAVKEDILLQSYFPQVDCAATLLQLSAFRLLYPQEKTTLTEIRFINVKI
jgi:hypothetical protein